MRKLIRNPIKYKSYIKIFITRFIPGSVVHIILEQNLYGVIEKSALFQFMIYRSLRRFLTRKIFWYIIALKIPIFFIQLILFLLSTTSKITVMGEENLKEIEEGNPSVIFALWHGNYTLLLISLRMEKAVALVHSSFRGNYISHIFSTFNYRIIQTSHNGKSIRELIKIIKQGYSGFITVDGPQGPPYQTKPGVIYIARKAGVKIVPLGLKTHRGVVLRGRWDKHVIPFPFARITVSFGKPIEVRPDDSLEVKGAEVTQSLMELIKTN